MIRIGRDGPGLELSGREFDAMTRRLGPVRRRAATVASDLPRGLLLFAIDLFSPTAQVGEQSGGGVALTVRGASLEAGSPIGRVVAPGAVFEPFRIVAPPGGGPQRVLAIPFTFLPVEAVSGPQARAAIVSALRDPLTERVAARHSHVALGVKPGTNPTSLRFVGRDDKAPAAGYAVTARSWPNGPPRDMGTTDREGRIVLEPGFADGLVIVRLLAGNSEPMVELPMMPGASDRERVIPFEPRPQAVALEAQLDSLRDEVLDLVAIRARLEARLKARAEGEDWPAVEATLKEFTSLPPRQAYADRLARLKDDAAQQQARARTPILTKTAQAQVTELQALIDRYLDDEVVKIFTDLLQESRTAAEKKKLAAEKKAAPARKGVAATKPGPSKKPAPPILPPVN